MKQIDIDKIRPGLSLCAYYNTIIDKEITGIVKGIDKSNGYLYVVNSYCCYWLLPNKVIQLAY